MKLFDIATTAEFLGTSRQTVDRLISTGALQAICIRSGKRKKIMRVREDVLRKFLGIGKNEPLVLEPALIHPRKKKLVSVAVNDGQEEGNAL